MTQRLKRWESPRREGRNDKGKGGAARSRQLKKQQQMLRRRLKEGDSGENNRRQGENHQFSPLFFYNRYVKCAVLALVKRQNQALALMSKVTRQETFSEVDVSH